MDDVALMVIEKDEVAGQGFVNEVYRFTLAGLLRGIAFDGDAVHIIDGLNKSRAIASETGLPTPKIWRVFVVFSHIYNIFFGGRGSRAVKNLSLRLPHTTIYFDNSL